MSKELAPPGHAGHIGAATMVSPHGQRQTETDCDASHFPDARCLSVCLTVRVSVAAFGLSPRKTVRGCMGPHATAGGRTPANQKLYSAVFNTWLACPRGSYLLGVHEHVLIIPCIPAARPTPTLTYTRNLIIKEFCGLQCHVLTTALCAVGTPRSMEHVHFSGSRNHGL